MEKIMRKSLLRKTGVEYGDYAANYVQGCVHGCRYPCYAYMMSKRFGVVKNYEDWRNPKIVGNTMELLDDEIPKLKKKIKTVQLCFTTDPFPYKDTEVRSLTEQVIKRLNKAGIKCRILTKGIIPIEMALYQGNEYGITLVTLDETFREKWEPGAAPLTYRLNRLKWLHDNGLKTWVSMEPYPTPNILVQDISKLLESVSFVDRIVFGRMNYNTKVTECVDYAGFYRDAAEKVKDFCRQHGIECVIKEGTVRHENHR